MPRSFFGAPPPAAATYGEGTKADPGAAQPLAHITVGAGYTLAAGAVDRMFGDAAAAGPPGGGAGGLPRLIGGDDRQLSIAFTIDQIISNGEDLGLVLADEMFDGRAAAPSAAHAAAQAALGGDLTTAEAAAAFAAAACDGAPADVPMAAARDTARGAMPPAAGPKDWAQQGVWPQQQGFGCDPQQQQRQPLMQQPQPLMQGAPAVQSGVGSAEDPAAWLDGVVSDDDLLLDDQGGVIGLDLEGDSTAPYSNMRGQDLTYSSCASLTAAMQGLNPSVSGPHVGTMPLARGGFNSGPVHSSGAYIQQQLQQQHYQQQQVLQQQHSATRSGEVRTAPQHVYSESVLYGNNTPGYTGLQRSPPLAAASPGDSSTGGPAHNSLAGGDRSYHSSRGTASAMPSPAGQALMQPQGGMQYGAMPMGASAPAGLNPWAQQAMRGDVGAMQQLILTQDMEEDGGLVSTMELPGVMRSGAGAHAAPMQPQQRRHAAPKQHQGTPPPASFADRLQGLITKTAALLGGDKAGRSSGGASSGGADPAPAAAPAAAAAAAAYPQQGSPLQMEGAPNGLLGGTQSAPFCLLPPGGPFPMGGGLATAPASSASTSGAPQGPAGADEAMSGGAHKVQSAHGLFRRRTSAERPRTMVFSRERMISSALERQAQHLIAERQHAARGASNGASARARNASGGQSRTARRRSSAASYFEGDSAAVTAAALAASSSGPVSDQLPLLRECHSGHSFPGMQSTDDATGSFAAGIPPAVRRCHSSSAAGRHSFSGEKRPVSDCYGAGAAGVRDGDSSKKLHSAFLDFVAHNAVCGQLGAAAPPPSDLFGGDTSAAAAFHSQAAHSGGWASGPAAFGDGGASMSCPLLLLPSGSSGSTGGPIQPNLSGVLPTITEGVVGLCPAPEGPPQALRNHNSYPHHHHVHHQGHGHHHMQQQQQQQQSSRQMFFAATLPGDDLNASGDCIWSAPAVAPASAPLWQSAGSCSTAMQQTAVAMGMGMCMTDAGGGPTATLGSLQAEREQLLQAQQALHAQLQAAYPSLS